MNAWILFVWIATSNAGVHLVMVDSIESKEACEKLLTDMKQGVPYAGAIRKIECTPYKMVSKAG